MFGWLAIAGASLLGWALYDNQKPKSGTTPLQNAASGVPYQIGQTVRIPLNQLPPNTIPPTALGTFNQVGVTAILLRVTSVQPGFVTGTITTTEGPGGPIQVPAVIPAITVPIAIIAGTA